MPLITMSAALTAARPGGLGSFNVITSNTPAAIVGGAESAKSPVVLQISENTAKYRGLAPVAAACLHIAAASTASVVVHLDHATSADLVREAVDWACGR